MSIGFDTAENEPCTVCPMQRAGRPPVGSSGEGRNTQEVEALFHWTSQSSGSAQTLLTDDQMNSISKIEYEREGEKIE